MPKIPETKRQEKRPKGVVVSDGATREPDDKWRSKICPRVTIATWINDDNPITRLTISYISKRRDKTYGQYVYKDALTRVLYENELLGIHECVEHTLKFLERGRLAGTIKFSGFVTDEEGRGINPEDTADIDWGEA